MVARSSREAAAGVAAQRTDDGIGVEGLVTALGAVEELDGVTVPVLADGIYGAAGPHLYAEAGHLPFPAGVNTSAAWFE